MTPTQIADALLAAAQHHAWWLVLAYSLIVLTNIARWAVPKVHGKLGALVNSGRGAYLVAFALAFTGAAGTGALAGGKFGAAVWLAALKIALASTGGYSGLKSLAGAWWPWIGLLVAAPAPLPELDNEPTQKTARPTNSSARALVPIAVCSALALSCTAAQRQIVADDVKMFVSCDLPAALAELVPLALNGVAAALTGSKLDQGLVHQVEQQETTQVTMCAIKEAEAIATGATLPRAGVQGDVTASLLAHADNVRANAARCFAARRVVFVTLPQHARTKERPPVRQLSDVSPPALQHWCRIVPAVDEEGEDVAQLICDDDLVPTATPRRQPRRAPAPGVREARWRFRAWGAAWALA